MLMKRKDMFFGIHFDFHAMPGQTVAADFRPDVVAKMLDEVKPDFVQCDTKGHAGLCSFPSKISANADAMNADPVRMWRDLTRERGIPIYAHHSGIYDMRAVADHPEWAQVFEDGRVSTDHVSVFSPYADEYLIPTLKELALEYGFDGAWVDGECWALHVDYSKWARNAYRAKTGKEAPRSDEEDYDDYKTFCRQGFHDYVDHYCKTLRAAKDGFEVTSNWLYSAYMPSKPTAEIDFISGDYSTSNSVRSARHNGRCILGRGFTWDLMAWGQNAVPCSWQTIDRQTKEYEQYCQEAAEIIALGGGFQFFNIMYGTGGTVQEWMIPTWKRVAEFCRARKEFCFRAEMVKEIAVVYTDELNKGSGTGLYISATRGKSSMIAYINLLQESGFSSSVLCEYQLDEEHLTSYKAVIVPGTTALSEAAVKALVSYASKGGILIVDSIAARFFDPAVLGAVIGAETQKQIWVDGDGRLAAMDMPIPDFTVQTAEPIASYYDTNYYVEPSHPAALLKSCGSGNICTLTFPLGESYVRNVSVAIRRFTQKMLADCGYRALVSVKGSSFADVIVMRKGGVLSVNLVNVAGTHQVEAIRSYDEIPAIGPLTVTVRTDKMPTRVMAEPEHVELAMTKTEDGVSVTLPRLDIHTVLRFEDI